MYSERHPTSLVTMAQYIPRATSCRKRLFLDVTGKALLQESDAADHTEQLCSTGFLLFIDSGNSADKML